MPRVGCVSIPLRYGFNGNDKEGYKGIAFQYLLGTVSIQEIKNLMEEREAFQYLLGTVSIEIEITDEFEAMLFQYLLGTVSILLGSAFLYCDTGFNTS